MTRDEVVTGLTGMLKLSCVTCAEENVVKAAIALLTPTTTAEIEDARDLVRIEGAIHGAQHMRTTLDRALDALAREPPATEQRYWRVEQHPCGTWFAFFAAAGGRMVSDGRIAPFRPTRAEAEADGRASGLPAWPSAIPASGEPCDNCPQCGRRWSGVYQRDAGTVMALCNGCGNAATWPISRTADAVPAATPYEETKPEPGRKR